MNPFWTCSLYQISNHETLVVENQIVMVEDLFLCGTPNTPPYAVVIIEAKGKMRETIWSSSRWSSRPWFFFWQSTAVSSPHSNQSAVVAVKIESNSDEDEDIIQTSTSVVGCYDTPTRPNVACDKSNVLRYQPGDIIIYLLYWRCARDLLYSSHMTWQFALPAIFFFFLFLFFSPHLFPSFPIFFHLFHFIHIPTPTPIPISISNFYFSLARSSLCHQHSAISCCLFRVELKSSRVCLFYSVRPIRSSPPPSKPETMSGCLPPSSHINSLSYLSLWSSPSSCRSWQIFELQFNSHRPKTPCCLDGFFIFHHVSLPSFSFNRATAYFT